MGAQAQPPAFTQRCGWVTLMGDGAKSTLVGAGRPTKPQGGEGPVGAAQGADPASPTHRCSSSTASLLGLCSSSLPLHGGMCQG